MNTSKLMNLATLGLSGLIVPENKAMFSNVDNPSVGLSIFIIFLFLGYIVIQVLLLMATYKLTHSIVQTILCLVFGYVYLIFAYIYYGFSGYKFAK